MARNGLLRRRAATGTGVGTRTGMEDTQDLTDTRLASPYDGPDAYAWPGAGWEPTDRATAPEPVVRRARVSFWATTALVLGLVGLCATLTGLLVPEGIGLGAIAVLAAFAGLAGASRPGITGHSLALLGLLAGLAAAFLGVAAGTGHFAWLSSHADAVPRWHDWLVTHWRELSRR